MTKKHGHFEQLYSGEELDKPQEKSVEEQLREVQASEESAEDTENVSDTVNAASQEEFLTVQMKLQEAQDRILRMQAEMENLRKRTAREIHDERMYASMPLVRDLLPVLDNLERTVEAAKKHDGSDALIEGLKLVIQQFLSVLALHDITPINALGELFDPSFHQSISQMPATEEYPAGTVMLVAQTGYMLHERVVRPSQVIVAK